MIQIPVLSRCEMSIPLSWLQGVVGEPVAPAIFSNSKTAQQLSSTDVTLKRKEFTHTNLLFTISIPVPRKGAQSQ